MTERERILSGVLYCVKVFLAVRIGLFVLSLVAVNLIPIHELVFLDFPGWPAHTPTPGIHNMFTALERQDALWFLRIATIGYGEADGSAAFFPLYPMLIRGLSFVIGGHELAAALLISNLSFLGGLCVLFFLTTSELSESAARRTVVYLAVFPTAFFFFAPYSESLFLFLAVTAFWAARRSKWPLAALAGALAGATRGVGVFIAVALALEALTQSREKRGGLPGKLAWSAAAGLGTVAYLAFQRMLSGDWLAPLTQQGTWQREEMLPWVTIGRATREAFTLISQPGGGVFLIDWLVVAPVLVAAVYALFRFRPAYSFYTWASLLVPLTLVFEPRPFLSMPRFALPLFPVFWSFAAWTEKRRVSHQVVLGVSAAGLCLLTLLFVNWYPIF
ncbi:MAG: mannosyltransferase family protein [Actinomycetota bacterium]